MAAEVVHLSVEDKSAWQLDDCPHRRPGCKDTATKEVVASAGKRHAEIRTCANVQCIKAALASAKREVSGSTATNNKKGSKKKGIR